MIIAMPDGPNQSTNTMLRIIRDHLGLATVTSSMQPEQINIQIEEEIPTTQMHVDTTVDQWELQPEDEHIYSRYTSGTPPPPLLKESNDGVSRLNLQLQNFYETARENSMRERLLTMMELKEKYYSSVEVNYNICNKLLRNLQGQLCHKQNLCQCQEVVPHDPLNLDQQFRNSGNNESCPT